MSRSPMPRSQRVPPPHRRARGFTLVELMIVILILAILAAVAIPQFHNFKSDAAQGQVANHLRSFVDGCVRYKLKTGNEVPDTSSGTWHPALQGFVDRDSFERRTPVEGVWDTEDDFGVSSAMGVHFLTGAGTAKDDAYMVVVDEMLDDGNLETGAFQKLGTARYYFILTP